MGDNPGSVLNEEDSVIINAFALKEAARRIGELEALPYNFYLTGSRLFRPDLATNSDYDFFVEHSDSLVNSLIELGYRHNSHETCAFPYTGDPSILQVLTYNRAFIKVDVQIVKCAETKHRAQTLLSSLGVFRERQEKNIEAHYWRVAFDAIHPIQSVR